VAKKDDNQKPIIIKKKKVSGGGGHHGGAWKVAYADFTTAMMAFFMLLWLLNVSDKKTLEGLADYFTPSSATVSGSSGSGKPLAGTSAAATDGAQSSSPAVVIEGPPPTTAADLSTAPNNNSAQAPDQGFDSKLETSADMAMAALADELRQAIQNSPQLARHRDQILVEETPEGVRIQLTDKDNRPMFLSGTADFYDYARRMVREFGGIVSSVPNRVAISGHTDSSGIGRSGDETNWSLSVERANAARGVLADTGVGNDRFAQITGKADTEPLFPASPERAENRRIAILVLREAPVVSPNARE